MCSPTGNIKLFVIDVDGTLTDGSIYYDQYGNEMKRFCVRDGAAFNVAHLAGYKIMFLTGREAASTEKRANELKIDYVFQGVRNKSSFLSAFVDENDYSFDQLCYIGDDINDLKVMHLCGYVACPLDASKDVKKVADYISVIRGGDGAVRDIIEHIMIKNGQWEEIICNSEENKI